MTVCVGVDVGGTCVRAGVVYSDGTVGEIIRVSTIPVAADLEHAITGAVKSLAARHPVAAVGLAVAGFVAADRRTIGFSPHLPWRDVDLVARMRDLLELPVVLEHDCNAAAVAESRFGAAAGASVATLVALGTGIGGALLIDGAVFRGAHGVAPELGHLRVQPGGRVCACGRRGCWERYCSGTALATDALELLATHRNRPSVLRSLPAVSVTGRAVAAAAADGDSLALAAVDRLAGWLGEGLALVADVYDPELIVIGGGVSGSARLFLPAALARYAEAVTGGGHRTLARVEVAQLGDDAGMVGAATLAGEAG
ncbi:ROK family protein [Pseudonocardiaceae bacterium YIM PH 21723]|nr:ROK family protein [Pseudonocardiaceae bacterium YIM PH 21723]